MNPCAAPKESSRCSPPRTLDDFSATLRRALAEQGPSIIDVPVDYSRNTDLAAHLHDDPFE